MKKEKQYPIDKMIAPVQQFINQEKSGGLVLGLSVVAALILANSPWAGYYFHFFEQTFGFTFNGEAYLTYSLHHWINDGLMGMFFFVVGLELKKEIIAGELADLRKALLPIGTALGGMVVPAAIYFSLNSSGVSEPGWGIPMATDIAFALGVLYLLGNRVPSSLKVFLMALAIVDDLGAVLVIAFFYTSDISFVNLAIGLGFALVMFIGNKMGVKNILFYGILGVGGVWVAFLLSGVHATIAAVLAAFTIPADVKIQENVYISKITQRLKRFKDIDPNNLPILSNEQVHILDHVKQETNAAMPPLQRLERLMNPFVTFVVMPIFAITNAGVSFADVKFDTLFSTHIVLGVGLGLLFGKAIGVAGTLLLLVKLKVAPFPTGMTTRHLIGLGLLASIGFTMSLFVTSLAFTDPLYLTQAKIGIFTASIVGGVLGYLVLSGGKRAT
jgi:Na+:H+ antiporter, NhaA family